MCTNRISFSALCSFAQNRILVIFTFETFSVKKELELSRKRTQKMSPNYNRDDRNTSAVPDLLHFHFLFLIVVDLLPEFFFRYEFIKRVTENERVKMVIIIICVIINSNEFRLFQTIY